MRNIKNPIQKTALYKRPHVSGSYSNTPDSKQKTIEKSQKIKKAIFRERIIIREKLLSPIFDTIKDSKLN